MITSVLRLQAPRSEEGRIPDAFGRMLARVETISELHALLGTEGDLGPIDFAGYLGQYCERLRSSDMAARGTEIRCNLEPLRLDLDRAVPLGMIANELIMNALTGSRPTGGRGMLWIDLVTRDRDELRLEIGHDGLAMSSASLDGLGLQLVQGLCRQIGARREEGPGTVSVLTLPLERVAA